MDIKKIQKEINETAIELSKVKKVQGNKAAEKKYRSMLITKVYSSEYKLYLKNLICRKWIKLFSEHDVEDVIIETLVGCADKYDHEKNDNFCAYHIQNIRFYCNDLGKKEIKIIINSIPMDAKVNEDDPDRTEYENIKDKNENIVADSEMKEYISITVTGILSMVTRFYEHFKGKAANDTRYKYTQLFCTDYSVNAAKNYPQYCRLINKNEFFATVNTDFLDFFMSDKCRSIEDVIRTTLKKLSEITENCPDDKKDKEAQLPLQAAVYIWYMYLNCKKKVSEAAITQQKGYFDEKLKAIMNFESSES